MPWFDVRELFTSIYSVKQASKDVSIFAIFTSICGLSSNNPQFPNFSPFNLFHPPPNLAPDTLGDVLHTPTRVNNHQILLLLLPPIFLIQTQALRRDILTPHTQPPEQLADSLLHLGTLVHLAAPTAPCLGLLLQQVEEEDEVWTGETAFGRACPGETEAGVLLGC